MTQLQLKLTSELCVSQAELREEQQRYRQYLADELQRQKEEEKETEQLIEEKLKEVLTKREERGRLQREARNRLMKEVMEARSLQIQHKCEKTEHFIHNVDQSTAEHLP